VNEPKLCIIALLDGAESVNIDRLDGPDNVFRQTTPPQEASMKLLLAAALAAGGLVATAQVSSAMTIAPQASAASALVQDVAYGCGPGWHPNPWGRCVPNARVYYYRPPVYYYHPRAYYYGGPVYRYGYPRY
jgi:hypothetical protein